jgi:phosphate transport system substrate-binding protein
MKLYIRYQIIIFTAILFGGVLTAAVASASIRNTLIVTGTGASIGTVELMAMAFQKKRPGVLIKVLPSIGSTGGIKALSDDKIDIGLSFRPLKPEEQSAKIIEVPYGRTAFIFAVQDANPTKGFTLAEIEEIYAGKRKTWPDGTQIRLILRPVSDSFSAYLTSINSGLKSASEQAHSSPGMFVGITDQEAAELIEKTSGSFGTTSMSIVASEKRRVKALSVEIGRAHV